ncbi:MAG TPA: class I SAM-dependent methyltransferase [Xanthomonadales bacterium]|nr:class I SAM-dependent methyltransferase [Xanthomonadales bacterium]
MPKQYDQSYFDRWYRATGRVKEPQALMRKVRMAVAVAEFQLGRPIENVIDIGCGEGAWLAPLRALRPRVRYLGIDSSEYAIARYGRARNLRLLRFEQLAEQRFDETYDLLVCSDVMHYVPTPELLRGLSGFAEIGHGLAFMDLFAKGDAFVGDREEFQPRTAAFYRKVFAKHGWFSCGSHCYLSRELLKRASQLELASV